MRGRRDGRPYDPGMAVESLRGARPLRTLADVLDAAADVAAPVAEAQLDGDDGGGRDTAERDTDDLLADLWAGLDRAARDAVAVGGWTADDPLRLTKATVAGLLRCPRRAVSVTATDGAPSDELVVGLVVDAAAKLATLIPHRRPTADDALAFLAATGDERVADCLARIDDTTGDGLRADIAARVAALSAAWPAIEPAWWPRVEDPVRCRLAGGAVTLAGRLDLLLGGPPTDRRAVVVEVKGGRWYDGMRADGHFYALLVALRDGRPPATVVTVVTDGTTEVEPVRPAVLATAASRVEEALGIAAGLAAGEPPAARAGSHCGHCPVRPDCPPGSSWRAGDPMADR
jgi:hypothetical protein